MTASNRAAGMTIVELLIVISILAIIAVLGVPNLLSAKTSSNESSAIAALRALSSAQVACTNRRFIDVDSDGLGEYGFLGELSGGVPARNLPGASLLPALIGASFRAVNNGSAAPCLACNR